MKTKELFETLLNSFSNIGIEVEIKNWDKFVLEFGKNEGIHNDEQFLKDGKNVINEKLNVKKGYKRQKGLYAFYNEVGECLYIGKTTDLPYRLYHHLKTSIGKYDKHGKEWFDFFDNNRGQYTVYWKEIDFKEDLIIKERMRNHIGETLRISLERILTSKMLTETNGEYPKFEKDHPAIK